MDSCVSSCVRQIWKKKKKKSSCEACYQKHSTAAAFGQQQDLCCANRLDRTSFESYWGASGFSCQPRSDEPVPPTVLIAPENDSERPNASSHATGRFQFGFEWHRCVSEWQIFNGRYIKVWILLKWYVNVKIFPLIFPQSLFSTSI